VASALSAAITFSPGAFFSNPVACHIFFFLQHGEVHYHTTIGIRCSLDNELHHAVKRKKYGMPQGLKKMHLVKKLLLLKERWPPSFLLSPSSLIWEMHLVACRFSNLNGLFFLTRKIPRELSCYIFPNKK
jgi:hypothetical protein